MGTLSTHTEYAHGAAITDSDQGGLKLTNPIIGVIAKTSKNIAQQNHLAQDPSGDRHVSKQNGQPQPANEVLEIQGGSALYQKNALQRKPYYAIATPEAHN